MQLRAAGVGADGVKYRLETRRLHAVQRGVYRVGPLVSAREPEMAAVLACGPEAVVSHRSAAALWGLVRAPEAGAPVDVTVRLPHRRRRPGVRPHRGPRLQGDEVTSTEDNPVTTAARTLLDLAAIALPAQLEEALARAERRGLTSAGELAALIQRHRGSRGTRGLRAQLGGAASLSRSEAESRLIALVRRAQLPAPGTNRRVAGYEVDLL